MHIALLTPCAQEDISGNAVSTRRIATGLREAGDQVTVLEAGEVRDPEALRERLAALHPDLLHVKHAWKSGRLLGEELPPWPLVLQMPGTDLEGDLYDPERTGVVQRLMRASRAILVASEATAALARGALPEVAARVQVVPRGIRLGHGEPYPLRERLGIPYSGFLFLLPGGLRGVKNQGLAIAGLDPVVQRHPEVHLVLMGPVLEEQYGGAILEAVRLRRWCHHLDAIPHGAMAGAYDAADVVLNTSLAEGGSNAVLEAMSCGRPVLVSAVPGNLGLVRDGVTALTFKGVEGFTQVAQRLLADAPLRQRLGAQAQAWAREHHHPEREISALRRIYRACLQESQGPEVAES